LAGRRHEGKGNVAKALEKMMIMLLPVAAGHSKVSLWEQKLFVILKAMDEPCTLIGQYRKKPGEIRNDI